MPRRWSTSPLVGEGDRVRCELIQSRLIPLQSIRLGRRRTARRQRGAGLLETFERKVEAEIGQTHPQTCCDVFYIFRQYQPERRAALPPRLVAPFSANH